jgi:hypothetical protein
MQPGCQLYNGVEMHVTRIKALEEAQVVRAFIKSGVEYPRIAYGTERARTGEQRVVNCVTIAEHAAGSIMHSVAMWSVAHSATDRRYAVTMIGILTSQHQRRLGGQSQMRIMGFECMTMSWPNKTLQRTRHGVAVCNRRVPCAGSLSLGR